jgi:hypothetical protein
LFRPGAVDRRGPGFFTFSWPAPVIPVAEAARDHSSPLHLSQKVNTMPAMNTSNIPSPALLTALGAALAAYETCDEVGLTIARARVLSVVMAEMDDEEPAKPRKKRK